MEDQQKNDNSETNASQSSSWSVGRLIPNSFTKSTISKLALCLILIVGVFLVIRATQPTQGQERVQDKDRAQDLYRLETKINAYIDSHGTTPPPNLSSLNVTNLRGKLSEYKYSFTDPASNGGQKASYELCTTFQASTLKLPISYDQSIVTAGGSADTYASHRKGLQCFSNDYYKSSSHILLVLNEDEKLPAPTTKTYKPDFAKLLSTTQAYYDAQAEALNATHSDKDLTKICIQSIESSDTPSGKVFHCSVELRKSFPANYTIKQGVDMMAKFVILVQNQGFNLLPEQDAGPTTGSDTSQYYQDYTAETKDDCKVQLLYRPNGEPPEMDYAIACHAPPTSEVPDGFTLASEDNSPV